MKDEAPHKCFYKLFTKISFPYSDRKLDLKGSSRQRRFCSKAPFKTASYYNRAFAQAAPKM
jgi:hypothetical protein